MANGDEVLDPAPVYPVGVRLEPALEGRDRLTAAFRFFLALPHLILVGGPVAVITSFGWSGDGSWEVGSGSGGVLGIVIGVVALISWVALVFAARHPDGLWKFTSFYLRWRVKAIAYMTLLRDEYPPFGDGEYPAELEIPRPERPRSRLTVFFRMLLALPHVVVLWFLSLAWAFTTALAWVAILFTGRYPETLYGFALGVLAWSMRVEAYVLLMRDEYPPFTLRV
jgi:hypothetical protein